MIHLHQIWSYFSCLSQNESYEVARKMFTIPELITNQLIADFHVKLSMDDAACVTTRLKLHQSKYWKSLSRNKIEI